MSSRTSRLLLAGLFSAVVACFSSAPLPAQEKSNLLEEAKQRLQVEIQRVEADVKQAKEEARTLSVKEPTRAVTLLRAMRESVATHPDLPDANRAALLKSLDLSIMAYNARANDLASAPLPPLPSTTRTEENRKAEEAERLRLQLAEVDRLRRGGRTDEASRLARQIAADHPDIPAARAEGTRATTSGAIAAATDIKRQKEENLLLVWNDVDRAAMPPRGDIEFPKDWVEKTAKRSQTNMTKEERKLIEALNAPVDVDLKDSTLEAVIGYLQDKSGVTIVVPKLILEEKAITYQTPVSVTLKNVTLRTVLKKVLGDVGLTYIVKDNVIQGTTEERAKLTLTTRTYYVGDVASLTDLRIPRFAREAQAARAITDMIGVIVGTIDPNSWWVNGGPGRIVFDPRTMSLVVTQTAEVHYMMGLGKR